MAVFKTKGFTLVELMVVIAIIAILASITVPGMRSYVVNNRRVAIVNDYVSALHLARFEAVKRSRNVVVCGSADASTCSDDPADWQKAGIIFVDADRDASMDADEQPVASNVLDADGFSVTATAARIVYTPSGVRDAGSEIRVCSSTGEYPGSYLHVTASGRVLQNARQPGGC